MGYHVADRMSTMLVYGRDNTSEGLREIDNILDAIRSTGFRPDAKRADMFPHSEEATLAHLELDEKDFDGQNSDSSVRGVNYP